MSQQNYEIIDESEGQKVTVYPASVQAKFALAPMVAMLPIDVLAHLGLGGMIFGGIISYGVWKMGPDLYEDIREQMPFLPALAAPQQQQDTPAQPLEVKQSKRGFWDRALGRRAAEPVTDEQDMIDEQAEEWNEEWYDQEDAEDIAPSLDNSMFTFSQLLASGFRPSLHKIFLGRLADGTDVFVPAKDLCHVALAGNTGNGKSSLLRLIMAQLCAIRTNVVYLSPHYTVYDREHDEDWTPYTPYLARNPMDYVTPDSIAHMLKWIVEHTLTKRAETVRHGGYPGKPYFIIIDELPAIIAKRRDVVDYIAEILREGRKYGLFLIVASQDFLVKTIGMDDKGGAVRKCFRTACYVGGDPTTANVLLERQAQPIPESDLGKGVMMLRCSATRQAVLAKVPYCDNEALYQLLGPSTFRSPSAPLPQSFRSPEPEASAEGREVAWEASGSNADEVEEISDLSTIRALREIGKRLKKGEDPAKIVQSFGLPYGRATQEMSAVVEMVARQIESEK